MKKLFCTLLAAGMLLTYGMSVTAEAAAVKVQIGDLQYTSWWYDLWHDKKDDPPPPPPPPRHHHKGDNCRVCRDHYRKYEHHRPDDHRDHRPDDHRNHRPDDHRPDDHRDHRPDDHRGHQPDHRGPHR